MWKGGRRKAAGGLAARFEDHDGQRGQRDFDGMGAAVGHVVGGHDAGAVAHVAAAVEGAVAIENFFVPAAFGDA